MPPRGLADKNLESRTQALRLTIVAFLAGLEAAGPALAGPAPAARLALAQAGGAR